MGEQFFHTPVLVGEVVAYLTVKGFATPKYLDCTIGLGGHTKAILEGIPYSSVLGLDRDAESLRVVKNKLSQFVPRLCLINADFRDAGRYLKKECIQLAGIIIDLGISKFQLETTERGFSFLTCGPLDMRIDRRKGLTAEEIVNNYSFNILKNIISEYGEERWAHKIAKSIVSFRKKSKIRTTTQLAQLIEKCVPHSSKRRFIHPATRTFQALRIFVNSELENLKEGILSLIDLLAPEGRMCVISFHSLEDRLVKHAFIESASMGIGRILIKKPITPSASEVFENKSARSAKMRVFEKIKFIQNENP